MTSLYCCEARACSTSPPAVTWLTVYRWLQIVVLGLGPMSSRAVLLGTPPPIEGEGCEALSSLWAHRKSLEMTIFHEI